MWSACIPIERTKAIMIDTWSFSFFAQRLRNHRFCVCAGQYEVQNSSPFSTLDLINAAWQLLSICKKKVPRSEGCWHRPRDTSPPWERSPHLQTVKGWDEHQLGVGNSPPRNQARTGWRYSARADRDRERWKSVSVDTPYLTDRMTFDLDIVIKLYEVPIFIWISVLLVYVTFLLRALIMHMPRLLSVRVCSACAVCVWVNADTQTTGYYSQHSTL